jgi:cytochrome P450 family 9
MKIMFGLLSTHAQDFVNYFEEVKKRDGKAVFELKDIFARFTADGISTAVLGFEGDCVRNENSYVFDIVQKFLADVFSGKGNFKFLFASALPKLYSLTGIQLISKEVLRFFQKVVVDVINERDQKGISRPDVIQLLLQVKKGQLQEKVKEVDDSELANFSANVEYDVGSNKKKITHFDDEDLLAQGFVFFGAGFETTSSLLFLTSYELAKNQDIQKTLIEEVDEVLKALDGKPITYEALHKMKFLDMVIIYSN